ncbi:class I SAM-dependent methyltransferase, partial [Rhizobium ruizarguesonis]
LAAVAFEKTRQISKIMELYAEEIFDGISRISLPLIISNEASHHENHMDMIFVVASAKHRDAKRMFEFGTYMGRKPYGRAPHI